jgi:hypothetical protein
MTFVAPEPGVIKIRASMKMKLTGKELILKRVTYRVEAPFIVALYYYARLGGIICSLHNYRKFASQVLPPAYQLLTTKKPGS